MLYYTFGGRQTARLKASSQQHSGPPGHPYDANIRYGTQSSQTYKTPLRRLPRLEKVSTPRNGTNDTKTTNAQERKGHANSRMCIECNTYSPLLHIMSATAKGQQATVGTAVTHDRETPGEDPSPLGETPDLTVHSRCRRTLTGVSEGLRGNVKHSGNVAAA